jgi:NADPH:quinone reductase-like Zn-dependent oxidoreductase
LCYDAAMRAWSLTAAGLEHLSMEERRDPTPGRGEVLVRIKAASLNYRDLMIATGRYSRGARYPLIPLSDGAGEIAAVGSDVTEWRVGDRVATSFFSGWVDGPQTPERSATALGGAVDGVLAEAIVLPARGVVRTPEHMSDVEAATLPCAAVTAWHALFEGVDPLRPGQTVLLEGTGGVSIFGLQLAKLAGARVIITSSQDEKLARARHLGADETINYRTEPEWQDRVRESTRGRGVDHVLEVGGKDTLGRALAALTYAGQIHLIGGVSGISTDLPLVSMARNNARVRRIFVGSVSMFEAMNRALSLHRTRPVVDRTFRFDEVRVALEDMQKASHFGKIVLVP